jgi:hypothetical protein
MSFEDDEIMVTLRKVSLGADAGWPDTEFKKALKDYIDGEDMEQKEPKVLPKIMYKVFNSKRPFGIELEVGPEIEKETIKYGIQTKSPKDIVVSRWNQTINNNYWHVKEDSTCGPKGHLQRDYGWEIASYKASGLKDILHISSVADHLATMGVRVNNNCGFHIHGEVAEFTPSQVGVIMARWIKVEPVMMCLVPRRRVKNIHCAAWAEDDRYDPDHTYNGRELYNLLAPTFFGPHDNQQKRKTLNFVNYAACVHPNPDYRNNRKTVELRLPEGTLDGTDISSWIKLYLMFIESCKSGSMPSDLHPVKSLDEFFRLVGLAGREDEFFILSRGLYKVKRWILEKILNSEWVSGDRNHRHFFSQAAEAFKLITEPKNPAEV